MVVQHQNRVERGAEKHREEGRQPWRRSTLLMLIVVLVAILVAIAFGYWRANGLDALLGAIKGYWMEVLVHALLTAVIGGLLIHQLAKRDEINEIKEALRDTLLADPVIVELLSKKQKSDTIERLIRSIVPDDLGDLFFKAMVKPYLNKYGYRSKFQYDVSFSLKEKVFRLEGIQEILFPMHRYHWINVNYVYAVSHEHIPNKMRLAFVADEKSLEEFIGDSELVFREGMFLDTDAWDSIGRLSEQALKTFIAEFMGLKLSVNNSEATLVATIPLVPGSRGFYADFGLSPSERESNQKITEIKLEFGMPYTRSTQWYLVTLPYPTNAPEIRLHQHVEQQKLAAISFITRHDQTGNLINQEIKPEKGWEVRLEENCAFPRSGVMFVWNDPEFHKKALNN